MKKVKLGIISLGCDKNRYDTEKMMNALQGFSEYVEPKKADYIFINTCAFLQSARDEMVSYLDKYKKKKIILGGCFKKFFDENFRADFPQVVAFVDPKTDEDFLGKFLRLFEIEEDKKKAEGLITTTPASHAYIKIAEGCSRNCAFCLIPTLTGKYRSRKIDDIIADIALRAEAEIKEMVLVAQDTGMYGMDIGTNLLSLLKEIEKIPANFWVRILYLYPETINDELLKFIDKSEKVLPYFDMPIQHFSPDVLKKMNRGGAGVDIIKKIRKVIPDAVIRTTAMVGFPSETERDFRTLKKDLKKQKPEHLSVFAFSSEPGTAASDMTEQVSEKIKEKREKDVLEIGLKNRMEFLESLIGSEEVVLVDSIENGEIFARSWHFAPEVDGGIFIQNDVDVSPGDALKVRIIDIDDINLLAEVVD